jgi:tetratricopeptide (TPR) repeat protein
MAEGEFALVIQHLNQALHKESSGMVGIHDLYAMLADAAVQQRDETALHKYTPLLEETVASLNHTLYFAITHRAWGVIHLLNGEHALAETQLNQALDIFQQLDTRWQIGRTHCELAELALASGNLDQARDHLSRALILFEDIHALPDFARTHSKMAELA